MKKFFFLILCLNLCACKTGQIFKEPIPAQNMKWLLALDGGLNMHSFYTQKSGLILDNRIHLGQEAINGALQLFRNKTKGLRYFGPIEMVEHDSLRFFDVGYYKDKRKQNYMYLIAWNKTEEVWKKEMEYIHPFDDDSKLKEAEINSAREKWERLSNAHDHRALIEQSYTADAIYFNNGKADVGTEAIIARYAYMSNPGWQIDLTPIKVLAVQEDMVYEIGEYRSNGVGHYVIVWVRDESGNWKASFDFNF